MEVDDMDDMDDMDVLLIYANIQTSKAKLAAALDRPVRRCRLERHLRSTQRGCLVGCLGDARGRGCFARCNAHILFAHKLIHEAG